MARSTRAIACGLMLTLLVASAAPAGAWMRARRSGARVPFFGRYASSYSIYNSSARPQEDLWCIQQRYLASRPKEKRDQDQEAAKALVLDEKCGGKQDGSR